MNESVRSAETSSVATPPSPAINWRALLLYLIVGGVAGGASWYLIEGHRDYFQIPLELSTVEATFNPDPVLTAKIVAERAIARAKNHALGLGLAGVLIVGLLSAVPGMTSGSPKRTFIGLICGVILGALLGVVAGYAGSELFDMIAERSRSQDTTEGLSPWQVYNTMFAHGAFWGILGIGLTVSLSSVGGKRVFLRLLLASIGVGVFWSLCYPFTAAILFPFETSDTPIPFGSMNTLYWIGGYALLMSLAAGRILLKASTAPAPVPAPQ